MPPETLPNQRATWAKISGAVEDFDAWKHRTNGRYACANTELLCYLTDQLRAEGASLEGVQINHPVLGLLSHMSESNNRMQELVLAYLSLSVGGDSKPARKLIAGQRLHVGLSPDYVAETHCYGRQEDRQAGADAPATPAIYRSSAVNMRKALEMVEIMRKAGMLFVPMPVRDAADHAELVEQMQQRLEEFTSDADSCG